MVIFADAEHNVLFVSNADCIYGKIDPFPHNFSRSYSARMLTAPATVCWLARAHPLTIWGLFNSGIHRMSLRSGVYAHFLSSFRCYLKPQVCT